MWLKRGLNLSETQVIVDLFSKNFPDGDYRIQFKYVSNM